MNYRVIDLEAYPRRDHFIYFSGLLNPYVGATVEIDATEFYKKLKERHLPVFLTTLYCGMRAINAIPEFRRRIRDGGIVEYDVCPSSHTMALPNGTFCYCRIEHGLPYDEFISAARAAEAEAAAARSIDDGDDAAAFCFVTCIPWLDYTAITQPTPSPADSNPRLSWGKLHERDGRMILPMTILANHALVDGMHIAALFDGIRREFAAL